jgi:hypothetical protein
MAVDPAPELSSKASASEQPNRRYICNQSNLHSSAGALLTATGAFGELPANTRGPGRARVTLVGGIADSPFGSGLARGER